MSDTAVKEQGENPVGIADTPIANQEEPVSQNDGMDSTTQAPADALGEVKSEEKGEEKPEDTAQTNNKVREAQNGGEKTSSKNRRTVGKKNSKFDASTLPVTDDPDAIRAQVRLTVLLHAAMVVLTVDLG